MIRGNNGIINRTINAKDQAEIAQEKEALGAAVAKSMGKNKYGNLLKNELEQQLNFDLGTGVTEVTANESNILVKFTQSGRYYVLDKDGELVDQILTGQYAKVIFDANGGEFSNGFKLNNITYDMIEFQKTKDKEMYLYTDNLNEKGEKIQESNSTTIITNTKTITFEGANRLKISIKHGAGIFRAIKSVPQAEAALWQVSSNYEQTDEFEIEGDTVNIYFDGPIGGNSNYWGYYATIKGYDKDGKIITEKLDETDTKIAIIQGKIEIPKRNESSFRGWYFDKSCTKGNEVIFNDDGIIENNNAKAITVYAKWATETFFDINNGLQFNSGARSLTGVSGQANYDPMPAEYFKKSEVAPSNNLRYIEVQDEESAFPIYMWYEETTKTLYWYCEVKPKMKGKADSVLYLWKDIKSVDFTGIDMKELTEISIKTYYSKYIGPSEIILDDSFYESKTLKKITIGNYMGEILDLSKLNLNNLDLLRFEYINSKTIYVNNTKLTTSAKNNSWFLNCQKLKGGADTQWNSSNTGGEYALIDGGTSNPGYFTQK